MLKDQVLIFLIPDLAFWRSTEPKVGRPSGRPMCIERAHNLDLRADRPGGRPIQRFHSLDLAPVDQAVDRPRALLSGSSLGRPSFAFWILPRSTDRSSGLQIWPQRLYFWTLFKGLFWLVFDKVWRGFLSQFFPSLSGVFSTYFWAKTSISKGEFLRVFCKRDFLSFSS